MLIVLFAIKSFLLWREYVVDGFTHAKSYHDIQKHSTLSVKNIERKEKISIAKKEREIFGKII